MIALFTDFGVQGPYTGQVRAVLLELCPSIPAVDVFSDLPAQNIQAAAYLLPAYTAMLPDNTVNLCVVDPGVGSERKALVIQSDRHWFVGPDNGLFSQIVRRSSQVNVREITWRPQKMSSSFHGRDLFAPVAAMLASGRPLPDRAILETDICQPDWPDDLYEVVYIDGYGNAITGIRAEQLDKNDQLEINGQLLDFSRTFSDQPLARCFWYENANGLVEIAANQASARDLLDLQIGEQITCRSG